MEELSREEALRILEESQVAHIGVVAEGKPYVTPMSFVVDGDCIRFRTMGGRKFRAMKANPTVCVEVSRFDEETGDWVSVVVDGTAEVVTERPTGIRTVEMLMSKYSKAMGPPLGTGGLQPLAGLPHVVEVKIAKISGMSSGRGLSPRTRPGRL